MRFCYIQDAKSGAAIVSRPRNFLLKIRLDSRRRAPDILKITTAPAWGKCSKEICFYIIVMYVYR